MKRHIDFRRCLFLFFVAVSFACPAFAGIFGTVRGIVHDTQHRPIPGITVVLKAENSDYTQTAQTDAEGEFHFDSVPVGQYTVTVTKDGFAPREERITVLSGTAPILHLELQVATQSQSVTVTSEVLPPQTESITPTTLISRQEIAETPGASRTNSLALITDYVPGSYVTHDQLHIRGGHQVSWLIDGVPIPNTNIASNLGPQIDPKDTDFVEAQRGSYAADYGDRTYGIFNVAPRTGFERNNEAELVLGAGNFYQTDDQINFGGHTSRFAYYASLNGNRTNLGLQTPTSAVIHDAANGYGGFTSLIYNASPQDQYRFVAQIRRDYFQVPFDPNDPNIIPGTVQKDYNQEKDGFATFSWVHTFNPGLVLTVSPFYHYNSADYHSSPLDIPSSATEDRSSQYEGGQATISWVKDRNNLRAGAYGFAQQDSQLFGLTFCADLSIPACVAGNNLTPTKENPDGSLLALYAEDQFKVTSWLTLNAGLRQTHFSGDVVENATSPRVGGSIRIPKLNWVFRGFYGRFYQAPPLITVSGPLLEEATNNNLGFVPLHGERDEEHQFGVTIPLWGWTLDADNFLTRAKNFFDHNNFNNSDIFFPITIQGARINGWELTLRSPRIRHRAQVYLTYSNQLALGFGDINGGLTDFSFGDGFGLLDHDQRNTLHIGGQYALPWQSYASTDVYYASGFTNGDPTIPGDHLQPHATFDLGLGKNFGEKLSVNLQGINVANRRVLLDNSFTFGGTHFLNPREILVQVRYRFHF
jgi:TonB dependent receptor/Carboxypeptidase regulatory-like domain/TonB-dependent Receptor Plug Domain